MAFAGRIYGFISIIRVVTSQNEPAICEAGNALHDATFIHHKQPGTWQRGSMPDKKLMFTPHYLKISVADQPVVEIDAENMLRRVAGVDQMADQRRALGL